MQCARVRTLQGAAGFLPDLLASGAAHTAPRHEPPPVIASPNRVHTGIVEFGACGAGTAENDPPQFSE